MEKLSEKEWKAFQINAEFRMKKQGNVPTGALVSNSILKDGMYPRIRVTSQNNGVNGFTNVCDDKNYRAYSNFVSMSFLGNAFYHPYTASLDMKVHCLQYKDTELNPAMGLFTVTMAERIASGTNYGNQLSSNDLATKQILLPVDDKDNPDYAYMAEYAQQKRETMLNKYLEYVEEHVAELEHKDIPALDEKEWKPIFISSMFELVRGCENNMAMLEDGYTPLISAKANNNGLKGFVHNPKKIIAGQCITLNNDGDGGAGLAYYQPANMALDSHVTALVPLFDMSAFVMLFIAKCISGLHGFFGHGLSISNPRAKRLRIMLPVTDTGEPDYAYMEQYSKNMMLRKYKQYLEFINRQNATEVD